MIERNPVAAESDRYDLIVVGGGISGIAIALETVARGFRPLLLERADFGSQTSAQTLRILHGGLRYLQFLSLKRFRRSIEQRRWWLTTFPELVRPLPCLMPLYGRGLRRRGVLRVALGVNDLLSLDRNWGLSEDRQIPSGRVLDAAQTRKLFPGCEPSDLSGAALWHDASMESPHRLMLEMLRWTAAAGGRALNYVSARRVLMRGVRVAGVAAVDELTREQREFMAPVVVNAAGPWCRQLAGDADQVRPELFHPSLAFNVLLRKRLSASVAVAVSPRQKPGRSYFLRAEDDLTFAGTYHVCCTDSVSQRPEPADADLLAFLRDLDSSVPDFSPSPSDVVRVFAGFLPAAHRGSVHPRSRPVIVNHAATGGPVGLISVSGVKFTTAPALARSVLDQVPGVDRSADWLRMSCHRPDVRHTPPASILAESGRSDPEEGVRESLRRIVEEEAVVFVEDLLERRLDWNLADVDLEAAARTRTDLWPHLPSRRSSAIPGQDPGG